MDDLNYNDMVGTSVSQLKQKQKQKSNISQLARNMELDLQKNNYSDNENNNSSDSEEIPVYKNKKQYKKITNNFYNFKDYDIIILSIIFLLLNINYSINFLNGEFTGIEYKPDGNQYKYKITNNIGEHKIDIKKRVLNWDIIKLKPKS